MSALSDESATALGAIDRTAVTSTKGAVVNPHVLRSTAMIANRVLKDIRSPIMHLMWDASTDGNATTGILQGIAEPRWVEATHGPYVKRKPPSHALARVHITYLAEDGALQFQVQTDASPLSELVRTGEGNWTTLTATAGSFNTVTMTALPLNTGVYERFNFFVNAGPLSTAASGEGDASGTVYDIVNGRFLVDDLGGTTPWTLSKDSATSYDKTGHVCVVVDASSGNVLMSARRIVSISEWFSNSGGTWQVAQALTLDPAVSDDEARVLKGQTWKIYKLPSYRFAGISVYSVARY